MKKIYYYTAILTGLLLSTSCEDSTDLPNEGVGYLSVEVQKDKELSVPTTKAMGVDVNDFVIEGIKGFTGTYAQLKEKGTLELDKGEYTISAHSPGVMAVASEKPFFKGVESASITAGIVNEISIACSMQNVKVMLDVSKILSLFEVGTLKVLICQGESTDRDNSHLFTITGDKTEPWHFAPSNDLNLVITGTTVDGFEMGKLGIIPLELKNGVGTYQCLVLQVPGADTKSQKAALLSSGFNIKVTTVE